MNTSRKVIALLALSALYMWLMPYGSFSPMHYGFYLSIVTAIICVLVIDWGLKKYRVK